MKRVLFVGEHPLGHSGNSGMLRSLLSTIDGNRYMPACFVNGLDTIDLPSLLYNPVPFTILTTLDPSDPWDRRNLILLLERSPIDILFMVGIDLWRYADIFPKIVALQKSKKFKWGFLFPYDLRHIRKDWVSWINMIEFPFVYSEYGFNMLKPHCPNIRYFRPPSHAAEFLRPFDKAGKIQARRKIFFGASHEYDEKFVFGFIGNNQFRKEPHKVLRAYSEVKRKVDNTALYFHTDIDKGVFNLREMAISYGLKTGDLLSKITGGWNQLSDMALVYNSIDCLVNCSMQEGLSWTPLEAMLSGIPVIASDTTAQTELVKDAGLLVPCEMPAHVPMKTYLGESWVETGCCKWEDIATAMLKVALDDNFRESMCSKGLEKAKAWISGVSDINKTFDEMFQRESISISKPKIAAVLFAQRSSAGDVFMTTRCFRGLKNRYRQPLHYMTLPQYMDIIKDNPYIDKVLPWDEALLSDAYAVVCNPHGERILPGHWGRNCNSILSDFYWKILMVEPDDFCIMQEEPDNAGARKLIQMLEAGDELCIVHTTGGDAHFRNYQYMEDVCRGLNGRYITAQVGGAGDVPANADFDFRGKFTFNETAWLMNQASLAVTVDSFVSHLAGAFGVSQVCLFGSGNYVVCQPNQVSGILKCLTPDYVTCCPGLGPCSQAVGDCPVPCTGRHAPNTILDKIKEIEEELK
jgi:glycosyltransferase involved in cell wall biosynthesis